MKKMSASEVRINFGDFIKQGQEEEIIITKNGKSLMRVIPIMKPANVLINEIFDWGITGLKNEHVLDDMLEKYYGV